MSYVATVVIFGDYIKDETLAVLKEGTEMEDGRWLSFNNLSDYLLWDNWPGPKGPEAEVLGYAGNYLQYEEMMTWLRSLKWHSSIVVIYEANGDLDEPRVERIAMNV